ncbi:MAG TPA: regulatory domain protein [Dictyoglomaceae bacterium]|nr:regulatory domain protein [Dictyoglomaceae bacterium]HOL39049.1 regulatory domain protein [Dictyoglomaceae bacterium]HOP94388.1 regulatory domain protein [Dictyoglomaceae bacterium]HPP15775.1 regulatory domain protein [Dictyoglomaceae bacterium]HPU42764.1 regulatory domain protein [Dictyoglomaceae bacterium]
MTILNENEIPLQEEELDNIVMKTFLKTLEILGGPRKLILYRNLTWVPSLIEACYAIVLKDKYLKTEEEIAAFLGITRQSVRNILNANSDVVLDTLEDEMKKKEIRSHVAGGLAKLAYKKVKEELDIK